MRPPQASSTVVFFKLSEWKAGRSGYAFQGRMSRQGPLMGALFFRKDLLASYCQIDCEGHETRSYQEKEDIDYEAAQTPPSQRSSQHRQTV